MSDLFSPGDRAYARRDDPYTSHLAADAASNEIEIWRARVDDYARAAGPEGFCDRQMEEFFGDGGSTARTRRDELSKRNVIINTGRTMRYADSARERIIWVHRDHCANPPPLREPAAPRAPKLTKEERAEAVLRIGELTRVADGFRRQGYAAAAEAIAAGAATIDRLLKAI